MSFDTIPAFSMSDIQDRDAQTIAALKLALTTHGFFTITDHGISDEILQKVINLARIFFHSPKMLKTHMLIQIKLVQEAIPHLAKKLLLENIHLI